MPRLTISFTHPAWVEKRDDHWAAYSEVFGIVVYGRSEEDAERKLDVALELLLDTLMGKGTEHLVARFAAAGIPYLLREEDSNGHVRRIGKDVTHQLTPA